LLTDPDIDRGAKKAISRQLGEHEAERDRLQQAPSELAEQANENTGRLAYAVRQALAEARESLDAAATSAQLREFVERWVGPMVLQPDGTIAQKQSADGLAADVKGALAGARSLPLHAMRAAFWGRLR
jgi:hypothetical protein